MQRIPGRPWRLPVESAEAAQLAHALGVSAPFGRLLWARGFRDAEAAHAFLDARHLPHPDQLPEVDRASLRLCQAIGRREGILIYGDYDADGLCSTALLLEALTAFGARVQAHVPKRTEGYGLRSAVALAAGVPLCITVDNGTTANREVQELSQAGIDVVICDHHQPGPTRPPAVAVVNPWMGGPDHPLVDLAGVGVTWCLIQVVAKHLGWAAPEGLDLVALGTIADVVPMAGPNRALVREGLRVMAKSQRPGLSALLHLAQVPAGTVPQTEAIAFGVAPRLNAPGRLGDPRPVLELLLARNEADAQSRLGTVEQAHRQRQRQSSELFIEVTAHADREPQRDLVLLAAADWPRGLLGPAAARLSEEMGRPVLLGEIGADGVCRGSGRSPAGFDLTAALARCKDALERFGGHEQAAGFEVTVERLPELRRRLSEIARVHPWQALAAWEVDVHLRPEELTASLALECVLHLEPFGPGNPEPLFALAVPVRGTRRVGEGGRHLRLQIQPGGHSLAAIAFGAGIWAPGAEAVGRIELLGRPTIQQFRGKDQLQFAVSDLRPESRDWERFLTATNAHLIREHPDRETLAVAYRRLRSLLARGPVSPNALGRELASDPLDRVTADVALTIFREAGLVTDTGLSELPEGTRIDLRTSPRFRVAERERAVLHRVREAIRAGSSDLPQPPLA